jgi:hypothetical protein
MIIPALMLNPLAREISTATISHWKTGEKTTPRTSDPSTMSQPMGNIPQNI